MISLKELQNLSRDRIREAEVLMKAKLYDGAFYLCGYAVEIGLKKRICQTLRWKDGYPKSEGEFKNLGTFKTHDLDILLHLSGIEEKIKKTFFIEWSIVISWKPELRYISRTKNAEKAKEMLEAVKKVLSLL
jgi:HEPN domain-containing protein